MKSIVFPRLPRGAWATPLLFLACGLAGCSDDAEFAAEAHAQTIPTVPERDWSTGESRLVRRFHVPKTLAGVDVIAKEARIVRPPRTPKGTNAIEMVGAGRRVLPVPLPAELGEFNQLSLDMLAKVHSFVEVELWSEGEHLYTVPEATVIGRTFNQELKIDMPGLRALERKPDELRLRFSGGGNRNLCWNLALWHRPWESWAEDASQSGARPVLRDIARAGSAIATDNGHTATFRAPDSGVLQFYFGSEPVLSAPDARRELQVTLTGDEFTELVTLSFPRGPLDEAPWKLAELPLEQFAGKEVNAHFRVTSDFERVDYGVLSQLTVFAPIQHPKTVVFVTSDTHRADHVATHAGSVAVETPTLDALGARGVIFDDCYSSTNVTIPSHVALLTATLPRDTMVLDNMSGVGEEAKTLAEAFHAEGYATYAAVSGAQLQHAWSGLGQGFDAMASPDRLTWDGETALQRLEELVADAEHRNLFVWLHLFDAHRPYTTRSKYVSKYWEKDHDPFDPKLPEPEFPTEILSKPFADLRDGDFLDALYKAEVTYVDYTLSRLLAQDRFAGALIAVTGDHGECLGEYDIWWDHAGMYPQNLHVPMILAGPGVPEGRRVDGPVLHLDVGRTLLDLAGHADREFPGESMLRHLDQPPESNTPRFGLSSQAKSASLEMGGWFCVVQLRAWRMPGHQDRVQAHAVELYDLRPGGDALRDVAQEEVERASRMRGLILNWLSDQRPTGWVEQDQANDAERIGQVQALGYTGEATDGSTIWIDPDCDCEPCTTFGRR